ncbi:hypothetical protein D3C86_2083840 [compost metagenome]
MAALGSGRYLWGYQWDAGQAGEGGCLFQDFVSGGSRGVATGREALGYPGDFARLR